MFNIYWNIKKHLTEVTEAKLKEYWDEDDKFVIGGIYVEKAVDDINNGESSIGETLIAY